MMTVIQPVFSEAPLGSIAPLIEVEYLIETIKSAFGTAQTLTIGRYEERIVHFRLEFHGGETWCLVADMSVEPPMMDCVSVAFGTLGGLFFDDGVTALAAVLR